MGLSGRKVKQRIGNDPRNLAWADDAAKFGQTYLSKFGWDASKGLGASGEGRISHIKVSQKLDMLGIGAAQQRDPNGIAWKQNKDFERVLERLNAAAGPEPEAEPTIDDTDALEKKRKREDGEDAAVKKKRKTADPIAEAVAAVDAVKPVVPRHRAHRARAIAAKNIASKSAAAISEILGVAPTSGATTPATPEGTLTPCDDGVELEKLTTSKKSVADYFKEKLLAKAGKSGSATPIEPAAEVDYDDAPRGGLGASRIKVEVKTEEEAPVRMGLGLSKLSSMMASAFSAAASTSMVPEEVKVEEVEVEVEVKEKKKKRKSKDLNPEAEEKKKKKKSKSSGEVKAAEEETSDEVKKSKKQRRREEEEEEERKRAKKERKRLKALQKAEAVE